MVDWVGSVPFDCGGVSLFPEACASQTSVWQEADKESGGPFPFDLPMLGCPQGFGCRLVALV
jgi:hypothetical protein